MTDDERRGTLLFCYAVALAARKLNDGDFRNLNCHTFLAHVQRLYDRGVKEMAEDMSSVAQRYGAERISEVYRLLEAHEATSFDDLPAGHHLRLVWSNPDDPGEANLT